MITIDGAGMEGGGQIVRTAVALSAITGEDVTIADIRRKRDRPGLAAQHIAAVNAVAALCGAECEGLELGSSRVVFLPGGLRKADTRIEVGTAGSIPLVLQAWMPAALRAGGRIVVSGGTEVAMSPTIDYCNRLLCRALQEAGARVKLEIVRRGYFPRGGGEVVCTVGATTPGTILLTGEDDQPAGIISCSSDLPDHVADRQAQAAASVLAAVLGDVETTISRQAGPGTGSSVTACSGWKGGIGLGRRGYPAEAVGRDAAQALLAEIERPGSVDIHLADQLLVPLALSGGEMTATGCSLHAKTVVWLLDQFGFEISVRGQRDGMAVFSA
jgi:RNA 3'-terminal phosphate cyclase (ATP)